VLFAIVIADLCLLVLDKDVVLPPLLLFLWGGIHRLALAGLQKRALAKPGLESASLGAPVIDTLALPHFLALVLILVGVVPLDEFPASFVVFVFPTESGVVSGTNLALCRKRGWRSSGFCSGRYSGRFGGRLSWRFSWACGGRLGGRFSGACGGSIGGK